MFLLYKGIFILFLIFSLSLKKQKRYMRHVAYKTLLEKEVYLYDIHNKTIYYVLRRGDIFPATDSKPFVFNVEVLTRNKQL